MALIITLVACAVVAAAVAFAVSIAPSIDIDPIDPAAESAAIQRSIRNHPKVRRFIRQRTDRTTIGGFLVTAAFGLVFATALVLGTLLALIDDNATVQRLDRSISEWGLRHSSLDAVSVIEAVTWLGSTPVVFAVMLVVACIDVARRRNREVILFVVVVGLGELLLNNGVKLLVRRDRPSVLHLVGAGGFSFPSGHSAAAAAGWSAIALILGRGRSKRTRAILAGTAASIAMAVATSRALLGVHWASDVVGGLAMGWGWFLVVATVFGGRRQHLGQPAVDAGATDVTHHESVQHGERTRR